MRTSSSIAEVSIIIFSLSLRMLNTSGGEDGDTITRVFLFI